MPPNQQRQSTEGTSTEGTFRGKTVKISKFLKTKMAEQKQQPTNEGETEVLMYKMKVLHVHKFKRKKIKKQI